MSTISECATEANQTAALTFKPLKYLSHAVPYMEQEARRPDWGQSGASAKHKDRLAAVSPKISVLDQVAAMAAAVFQWDLTADFQA